MATWAGALAAIQADLVLAAADVNALDANRAPFKPAPGEAPSPIERRLRYWYEGDDEVEDSFGKRSPIEKVLIRWYFPVVNRTDDQWVSDLEGQLQAANRATQKYFLLDEHLKNAGTENAIRLFIGPGATGWQQVGEAWIRVVTVPLRVEMAWMHDIGTL